ALADVDARLVTMRADVERIEGRAREAARLATELEEMNRGLNRLKTGADQIKLNEQRLARLRQLESEAREQVAATRTALTRTQWEHDGLRIALGRSADQLKFAEAQKSQVMHYARVAWDRYGFVIVFGIGSWFLGPPLGRLAAFFLVAPFISSRSPVRLGPPGSSRPEVVSSRASVEIELEPGAVMWVKEKYLQASDESLQRSTRWLLDWRMPFTCLAAGLRELIEMRNADPTAPRRATFSSQEAASVELAIVNLPAGSSLVLRPSFLAGLVSPRGSRALLIRRHWRFFTLQAWATGQFRYFEFVGPATLLLAGSRGVRAELLDGQPGGAVPGRRANQDATIGFTPGLAYRPVRAETFWAYFRGQNPLFDDLFEGNGLFLCQQTSAKGEAAQARATTSSFWGGVLRVFGL
ncbi:MAG: hypothetical protein Q8J74_01690, partial [Candidatus Didemnitutus sp.]|nr:hypothetical protein [Candidatus Didemnitutus sp.]